MSKVVELADKRLEEQYKILKNVLITATDEFNVCYEDHVKTCYCCDEDFREIEDSFREQLEGLNEAFRIIDTWKDSLKKKIGVGS